jgi:hypothetical protein
MVTVAKLKQSIQFLRNWKENDLKELQDDRSSNYALWVLEGHKQIDTILEVLELELDKRTYQE